MPPRRWRAGSLRGAPDLPVVEEIARNVPSLPLAGPPDRNGNMPGDPMGGTGAFEVVLGLLMELEEWLHDAGDSAEHPWMRVPWILDHLPN